MALSVWKYPLVIGEMNHISMPSPSEVLFVGQQRDVPTIWAWVPTDRDSDGARRPEVERNFLVVGTGHDLPYDYDRVPEHHGSCMIFSNMIVLHVFEYFHTPQ